MKLSRAKLLNGEHSLLMKPISLLASGMHSFQLVVLTSARFFAKNQTEEHTNVEKAVMD